MFTLYQPLGSVEFHMSPEALFLSKAWKDAAFLQFNRRQRLNSVYLSWEQQLSPVL